MTNETTRSAVAGVPDIPTDDGDTFDHGGHTYRVRIEPDECSSILDEQGEGVWCGRIEWGRQNVNTGRDERPADFTGGAERLHYGRSYDSIWWEVPADLRGDANREGRDATRRSIVDLLEYGYSIVSLERLAMCDLGHTHIDAVESLGMVEAMADDAYLRTILGDLLAELES